MNLQATLVHWSRGIRLYLGIGIALLTVEIFWWCQNVFGGSNLATIRLEETYAWTSVVMLVVALLIGPVTKALPKLPGMRMIRESRRLIGVGAAWFALLHAGIAYIGQFHASNPLHLPRLYQQSLFLGLIGLIALLVLAFTSFNAVMKAWGVWWFRVHRLVYVSALAALMHAFMVGTHATGIVALALIGAAAALWVGLNLYFLLKGPGTPGFWKIISLSYGTILLAAVINYGVTQHLGYDILVDHGGHSGHAGHVEKQG